MRFVGGDAHATCPSAATKRVRSGVVSDAELPKQASRSAGFDLWFLSLSPKKVKSMEPIQPRVRHRVRVTSGLDPDCEFLASRHQQR